MFNELYKVRKKMFNELYKVRKRCKANYYKHYNVYSSVK